MSEKHQISLIGKEISGCEILNKVAEGGMGAVYKARHKALNRIVCVKILSPSLANDKKAVELFLTEARAIAELDHPNIVNVYNVGKEHGYYFIVMSYIEGQTLSQMIKKDRNLPIGKIVSLFEGVLLGLDAAHSKGIIHRDIKPSNILVNEEGQPKVVDFGIAKKVDKEKGSTKTTELAGTAYFIAPEQALGKDLDTRADLYSVGASLYYVLTGHFPYTGKNTVDIIQKHIHNPVPNPSDLRKDIPGWLAQAVQKLMAKKPEDRFQTAKDAYLFFQKMRAEEQLRMKEGNAGKMVDLAEEGPLRLVREEVFQTKRAVQKQRYVEKQKAPEIHRVSSDLPSMPKDTLPIYQNEKNKQSSANRQMDMDSAENAKFKPVYVQAQEPVSQKAAKATKNIAKYISKLCILIPLFVVFMVFTAFIFHKLGTIASVHTHPEYGFIHNLIASVITTPYAPEQVKYMLIGLCLLVSAFLLASVKTYARTTLITLLTAFTAYFAGLFAPDVPFLHTGAIMQYIVSPRYGLCYLALSLLGTVSMCLLLKRTFAQGIFACALFFATLVFAYLGTRFNIPPTTSFWLTKLIGYGIIIFSCLAFYEFLSPRCKESMLLPLACTLIAIFCVWNYNISGVQNRLNTSLATIINRLHIRPYQQNIVKEISAQEKQLGFDTRRSHFANLDNTNATSSMTEGQLREWLQINIQKTGLQKFITEEDIPLIQRFLTNYYHGGKARMKINIWLYALGLPADTFCQEGLENDVFSWMLILLFALGSFACVSTVLFNEEL